MRTLSPALAAHLASGATTLCRCWKLARRDGTVMGFTDHDCTLEFEGVTFLAATGLDASEAEAATGLKVSGGEVSGALSDAGITEADIAAGLYDGAAVTTWRVNWADVSQRLMLDVAVIGEIRRADRTFVAELRGPMHALDQEQGRLYQRTCPAVLGDSRCGAVLSNFTTGAVVTAADDGIGFSAAAVAGYQTGYFAGGIATFSTGANAGIVREIRASSGDAIALWSPLPETPAPGDMLTLSAGCDKTFPTCQAKFANGLNFRGFPHIPAADFVLAYARTGEGGHDGGTLES